MKSSALILTLVISGISAWSCSKSSTPAADDKSAAAPAPAPAVALAATPAPAKVDPPKPAAPAVAAPVASSAAAPAVAAMPAATAPSGPDPRADIKTALPEAIRVLIAKDYAGFIKEFMPPSAAKQAGMTPDQMAGMIAMAPQMGDSMAKLLPALQSIKDQTPTIDPTGNSATFTLSTPVENQNNITFVKENGLWYLGN